MPQEQIIRYDSEAEKQSLRWAAETGPSSYQDRLAGIQRDVLSFQNEQLHPDDAYWNGSYELGVDSHGHPALVTSEIAIPGRVHRSDSHAMVDSMAGNAVYVLDQIEKGNMEHDAWDTAREQLKQFKAVQEEVLKLQEGESLLGFALNGCKTQDGVALMEITRHGNTFVYETRLIGGLTEGAAEDVLKKFTSDNATQLFLKEYHENPLYAVVKGNISIDLKNKQKISKIVQDVLDERNEVKIDTMSVGSCRTKEKPRETDHKKTETIDTMIVRRQQEYALGFMKKKTIEEIPYVKTLSADTRIDVRPVAEKVIQPVVVFDYAKQSKLSTHMTETVAKHISETEYLTLYQDPQKIIYPEYIGAPAIDMDGKYAHQQTKEISRKEYDIPSKTAENIQQQSHIEMPVATFLVKSESQELPVYMEKALTITVPVHKQTEAVKTVHRDNVQSDHIISYIHQYKTSEQESVYQPPISEEIALQPVENAKLEQDELIEVDQMSIQDMRAFIDRFADQVKKGVIKGEVKKLVWMEPISQTQTELMPVEEMEIDKDTTKTIHNLLHFLRKIVRIYAGNDVIRERGIKRIISDNPRGELEELEEYIHVLQASRFRGHMFAMVS